MDCETILGRNEGVEGERGRREKEAPLAERSMRGWFGYKKLSTHLSLMCLFRRSRRRRGGKRCGFRMQSGGSRLAGRPAAVGADVGWKVSI